MGKALTEEYDQSPVEWQYPLQELSLVIGEQEHFAAVAGRPLGVQVEDCGKHSVGTAASKGVAMTPIEAACPIAGTMIPFGIW